MTTADLLDRVLEQLGAVRVRCPELRFGQLIATIAMLAEDETGHALWDVDDADFAAALERFVGDMARRGSDRADPAAAPEPGGTLSSAGSLASEPPRQVS
jgi:hypothetical protein